jgi:carbon monoxide dehydrogenase subunit G
MARYKRTVQINAAPAIVWFVLADIERWPEWTPSILKIIREGDGSFGVERSVDA